MLLVDARNAVNRLAALWNARILWPRCSRFLFLILTMDMLVLLSKEGVTQCDPLSMMMYAVALLSLICSLEDSHQWIQNWYADDSSCIGELFFVKRWFDKLPLTKKRGHVRSTS